jgi:thiamine-phosphate pyrophosphorylase
MASSVSANAARPIPAWFFRMLPSFYPILDPEIAARHGGDPIAAAEQILEGGATILQFRHKGFFSHEVFAQLEAVAQLCRAAHVLFVVNDRADLAALTGAALHLGQDDLTPSSARKIVGSKTLIGFSTHNESQLRAAAAEPADYLALGPIFSTSSKSNPDPIVGIDELRRLRWLTDRPLVAIGGITRANVRSVLAAGADSVAIIGDLFAEDRSVRARTQEWVSLTRDIQNV